MEWTDVKIGMRCSIRRRPWLTLREHDASRRIGDKTRLQWSEPIGGTVVDIDTMDGVGVVAIGVVADDDGRRYKMWRAKGQKKPGVFRNMNYSYKRFGYVRVMLCDPSEDRPPRPSRPGIFTKMRTMPAGWCD